MIRHLIQDDFPNLDRSEWRITSDPDENYNCIAWAIGSTTNWWWPESDKYWPAGVAMEETVAAFLAALGTVGFVCSDCDTLENGFEKVALFALDDQPTHAARQLPDGKWSSKLGRGHDIEHGDLHGVAGAIYGTVVRILKRPRPD